MSLSDWNRRFQKSGIRFILSDCHAEPTKEKSRALHHARHSRLAPDARDRAGECRQGLGTGTHIGPSGANGPVRGKIEKAGEEIGEEAS
jgi:hypothetical protein